MPTIHLLVKGKVQGVFYRASAKTKAEEHCLTGWVKNTAEGHVEITATGETGALQKFTDWCRTGPADAHVTSIAVSQKEEKTFLDFRIIKE